MPGGPSKAVYLWEDVTIEKPALRRSSVIFGSASNPCFLFSPTLSRSQGTTLCTPSLCSGNPYYLFIMSVSSTHYTPSWSWFFFHTKFNMDKPYGFKIFKYQRWGFLWKISFRLFFMTIYSYLSIELRRGRFS